MSKGRYLGQAALAVVSALVLAACSPDTPTGPSTASQGLTATPPTIAVAWSSLQQPGIRFCYPTAFIPASSRGIWCYSSGYLYISNTGGGTLNWTSTKNASWIKRSPRYGTGPSTMKVWVDGTGLPKGTYYGKLKVWATGATNSPLTVYITMRRSVY
jgi:hypothetical protein